MPNGTNTWRLSIPGGVILTIAMMIPTLEINDRVVATKFTYQIGEPERGDVVGLSNIL